MAQTVNEPLKLILEENTSAEVTLLNMHAALLTENTDEIALPLEQDLVVAAQKFQVEHGEDGILIWHGRLPDSRIKNGRTIDIEKEVSVDELNSVILVRHGDNITGSIHYNGQAYQVMPLGDGEHAIIKVDDSKYPEDSVLSEDGTPQDNHPALPGPLTTQASQTLAQPTSALSIVRVMLVFTNQARSKWPDREGLAALMFAEANEGMSNSNIPILFEQAGFFNADYNELLGTTGYNDMLTALRQPTNTSLGQAVSVARDQNKADLVMMLSTNNSYCGMAYLNANKALGFGITSCATGNYTFAHEMGHNLGADHNSDIVAGNYGDAFGYRQDKVLPYWRTIMSAVCTVSCPKVNYWSNPDRTFNGLPIGIVGISNNTRMLNLRRDVVANFYPPENGLPPTGHLESPVEVDANQSFSVRAVASDEIGSTLSYRWSAPNFVPNYGTTALFTIKAPSVTEDKLQEISVEVFNVYGSTYLNKTILVKATESPPVGSCSPPWVANKVYASAGERVSFDGYNYEVAHWTQNNRPDVNFVETGAAKPWRRLRTCGDEQPNLPPVGTLDGAGAVDSGKAITFTANASSPGNQTLSYSWVRPAGFSGTAGNTRSVTLSAPTVTSDLSATVSVTVTDEQGGSLPLSKPFTVKAPVIAAPVARIEGASSVEAGKALTLSGAGSTGNALRYAWSAPGFNPATSALVAPSFNAPAAAGARSITLTVTDASNKPSAPANKTVTVTAPTPVNRPPVGTLGGDSTVDSGKVVTFTANVSDPDGDTLTYTWRRPNGFTGTLGNTRSVTLTAPTVITDTNATVTVVVSDGRGGVLQLDKPISVKASAPGGNCGNVPAWSATKEYRTYAEQVAYNGMVYKQNFHSINKPPSAHSGEYGKEWHPGVACQ